MSASIFISHSAKDAPARQYLDAIRAALRNAPFDVWLDESRLKGGDDWGFVIANAMAWCHGAVVLITKQSLDSEYVKFEISNLFARWERETRGGAQNPIRFCPLIVPPYTLAEAQAHDFIRSLQMTGVNWIVPATPEEACARLLTAFNGLTGWPSPFEAILGRVRGPLTQLDPAALLGVAQAAGFSATDMPDPQSYPARLAELLMRSPIQNLCRAHRRMLPGLSTETVLGLFELMQPSWVSFEAGQRLMPYLSLFGAPATERLAILNGKETMFTPLMYLMRARGQTSAAAGHVVPVIAPSAAGLSEAALLRAVHSELLALVRVSLPRRVADIAKLQAEFDNGNEAAFERLLEPFINKFVNADSPIIVALFVEPIDLDLVDRISARPALSQVTFVALIGDTTPPAPLLPHVLEPRLSPDYEMLACDAGELLISDLSRPPGSHRL